MKLHFNILPLAAGLIVLPSSAAFAHAMLVRSNPATAAKVKAPQELSLWFSEKIEPVFNKIEVVDGKGARVEDGKATLDGPDKTLLHVRLKPLTPGTYSVHWRVSGEDSHKMEGSFSFQVTP